MCVLGVEGSEKKSAPLPLRIISGTALRGLPSIQSPSVTTCSLVLSAYGEAGSNLRQHYCIAVLVNYYLISRLDSCAV